MCVAKIKFLKCAQSCFAIYNTITHIIIVKNDTQKKNYVSFKRSSHKCWKLESYFLLKENARVKLYIFGAK